MTDTTQRSGNGHEADAIDAVERELQSFSRRPLVAHDAEASPRAIGPAAQKAEDVAVALETWGDRVVEKAQEVRNMFYKRAESVRLDGQRQDVLEQSYDTYMRALEGIVYKPTEPPQ